MCPNVIINQFSRFWIELFWLWEGNVFSLTSAIICRYTENSWLCNTRCCAICSTHSGPSNFRRHHLLVDAHRQWIQHSGQLEEQWSQLDTDKSGIGYRICREARGYCYVDPLVTSVISHQHSDIACSRNWIPGRSSSGINQ